MSLVRFLPKSLLTHISMKKISRHFAELSSEEMTFWTTYFKQMLTAQPKAELLATYRCMMDYILITEVPKRNYVSADKLLIIDSPIDRSISDNERLAVLSAYPGASHLEMETGGHLSLIVEMDKYLIEIRKFLGG